MEKVNVGYEDGEGRNVCGCCRSYYVVTPEEADAYDDMYEALKAIKEPIGAWSNDKLNYLQNVINHTIELAEQALAKSE